MAPGDSRFDVDVSLDPDPVIEAYKKDVDRTLIRENLKRTPEERLLQLMKLDLTPDRQKKLQSVLHYNGLPIDARSITDAVLALFAEAVYRRDLPRGARDSQGCAYLASTAAGSPAPTYGMPQVSAGRWLRWTPKPVPVHDADLHINTAATGLRIAHVPLARNRHRTHGYARGIVEDASGSGAQMLNGQRKRIDGRHECVDVGGSEVRRESRETIAFYWSCARSL